LDKQELEQKFLDVLCAWEIKPELKMGQLFFLLQKGEKGSPIFGFLSSVYFYLNSSLICQGIGFSE